MKLQKTQPDIQSAYFSPLEEESLRLLDEAQQLEEEMQEFYPRQLKEDLSGEAEVKSESLRRAAVNMGKAARKIYAAQDEMNTRSRDIAREKKKMFLISAPANASIDDQEAKKDHFAAGLNKYKLMLVCFIGSFFGVIVEMLWCLVTRGYIESRAGLVYGPFNILYGAGAVLLTVSLYKYRNRSPWISVAGGFLVGSVLEYICSWGMEFVLGSKSWDYSSVPFNINGRICLLYSFFWGILAVVWIKNLYPRMVKWILKIPNRAGKILTWIVTVFLAVNIIVSGAALFRWSQRKQDIPPSNAFWQEVDEHFPDERMERVYANMEF